MSGLVVMNRLETLIEKYGVSHQLATKLLELGRVRPVAKGSFVVFKEQTVDFLTFPLEGRFGLSSSCIERANSVFSIITPGTALNEVQLLLREDCLADILATKNSVVLQVSFSACEVLLKECIEFSNFLGVSLAKKQRVFHTLFQLRAMKSNTEKVCRAVKVIAEMSDNNVAAINLISLASLLYMSRNTVSKEIKKLIEQGGLEEVEGGYVVNNLQVGEDCSL
ncbi:Crp/Fnr family transcriptional regulator [Vibrio sp. HN007]|uniref:Crp/Fnr family transcriptional regulator n=1 Tax=Vibrio iocasae TaxID=3098914 RepID=UPI0035D3EB17